MRLILIGLMLATITYHSLAQAGDATKLRATLRTNKMVSIPGDVPAVAITLQNDSNKPALFELTRIELFVSRDGIVIPRDLNERFDAPNCAQRVNLGPGQSLSIMCGFRVSSDSYSMGSALALRTFGYDLRGPATYSVYARARILPLDIDHNNSLKQAPYVQTPAIQVKVGA